MLADEIRHQVVSNNLANANTAGFKKDLVISQSFPEVLMSCLHKGRTDVIGHTSLGVGVADIPLKMTPGMIEETGSNLDLALDGEGFFTIQTRQGIRLTRQGNFRLNNEGYLINSNGDFLLGLNGPIMVDPKIPEITILADGSVFQNEEYVDKLSLVDYDPTVLVKEGSSRFRVLESAEAIDSTPQVIQRALERSNVNVIEEMVELISLMRSYESHQKLVQAQNETLGKLINEMAANT